MNIPQQAIPWIAAALFSTTISILAVLLYIRNFQYQHQSTDIKELKAALGECKNTLLMLNEYTIKIMEAVTPHSNRIYQYGSTPQAGSDGQRKAHWPDEIYNFVDAGQQFQADTAALRQVVQLNQDWHLKVRSPLTLAAFQSDMNYLRSNEQRAYVHISCHGETDYLQFGAEIATALWMNEQLTNVDIPVIVLASCTTSDIADLLVTNGRYVVAMLEKVDDRTDGPEIFTREFWTAIVEGMSVPQAFRQAVRLSPPNVANSAILKSF